MFTPQERTSECVSRNWQSRVRLRVERLRWHSSPSTPRPRKPRGRRPRTGQPAGVERLERVGNPDAHAQRRSSDDHGTRDGSRRDVLGQARTRTCSTSTSAPREPARPLAADMNGDGVVSTTEGGSFYGRSARRCRPAGRPLRPRERCSPSRRAVRPSTTAAPSRSTRRPSTSIQGNTGVIVVHGLDPATLSAKAQGEKSDLVPSLPLAATSPALCGALVAAQTTAVPAGGAATGAGGTSHTERNLLEVLGGAMLGRFGAAARRHASSIPARTRS